MRDLRVLRAEKRMTQQDVAREIGISRQSYNKIENGICIPKYEHAERLASLFKVEVTDILVRKEI